MTAMFLIISQVYNAAGEVRWAVVYFAGAVVTLVLDEVRGCAGRRKP